MPYRNLNRKIYGHEHSLPEIAKRTTEVVYGRMDSAGRPLDLLCAESYIGSISEHHIFRGQSNAEWSISSSISRNIQWLSYEETIFNKFKSLYQFNLLRPQYLDDWSLLSQAQHYGAKTRLTDWTSDARIALYFTVCNDLDEDGAFYSLDYRGIDYVDRENDLIFQHDDVQFANDSFYILEPSPISPNIIFQQGLHIVSNPRTPFPAQRELSRMVIPKEAKLSIMNELALMGINDQTIYPKIKEGVQKINEDLFPTEAL